MRTLLLLLSLFLCNCGYSQENYPKPLVVLTANGTVTCLDFINPHDIESIFILKREDGLKKYGNAAVNGVMEIQLKDEVRILDWPALQKIYRKIRKAQISHLFVDEKKVDESKWSCFSINQNHIKRVKILDSLGVKTLVIQSKKRYYIKPVPPSPSAIRIRGSLAKN